MKHKYLAEQGVGHYSLLQDPEWVKEKSTWQLRADNGTQIDPSSMSQVRK